MPSDLEENHRKHRVAIIGGGISGIACSWELRKHDYEADIYESETKLGGHANSVPFRGNGLVVDVDTGFVVLKDTTYPHFCQFLDELGVETIPTDMSFSVSSDDINGHEWSSTSVLGFVRRLSNLFNARFWRLVFDIIWFYAVVAEDILLENEPPLENCKIPDQWHEQCEDKLGIQNLETIGSYLRRKGYCSEFIRHFLIPMLASPWCTDPDNFANTFPAKLLIQFMLKHGLLSTLTHNLRWRSFQRGSKEYVDAFHEQISPYHNVYLNATVHRVVRTSGQVSVHLEDGECRSYDHVVLAVPANQALQLLENATALERTILSKFMTTKNKCVLHSDTTFLPESPLLQTAWNCAVQSQPNSVDIDKTPDSKCDRLQSRISVSFDMNKLQRIPPPGAQGSPGRIVVTMNPQRIPKLQQGTFHYEHPLITSESFSMARHLHNINGVNRISFAGAWMGFGFHEDGFVSGTHAARMIAHGRDKVDSLDLFALSDVQSEPGFSFLRMALKLMAVFVRYFR